MNIRKLPFVTGLALVVNFVGQAETAVTNPVNFIILVGKQWATPVDVASGPHRLAVADEHRLGHDQLAGRSRRGVGLRQLLKVFRQPRVRVRDEFLQPPALKFWSRAFTARNLLPSIASSSPPNNSNCRHSNVNDRATALSGWRLSLRKSAMVLKSGVCLPVSQMGSTLR